MRTATARSAGGVLFDDAGRVALLSTSTRDGQRRWTLPKGAVEKGETPEQAALREVREETGHDAEIVAGVGVIDYWFLWPPDHTRYHKFVHYFAMRATGGDFSLRDHEAEDAAWFDPPAAVEACAYDNEREIIRKAVASIRA